MITIIREIRDLASGLEVSFAEISLSTNEVVDYFAKNGVDGSVSGVFKL